MKKSLKLAYSPKEKMPLSEYALLTVVYNVLLAAVLLRRPKSPERSRHPPYSEVVDVALMGLATHKVSRLITRDVITSFIRAPFTRYEESLGYGEVLEKPRRSGALEVVGELLTCNYCMSTWVGLGFHWASRRYPRPARELMRLFSVIALSDFAHVAYERNRTQSNVLTLREKMLDAS